MFALDVAPGTVSDAVQWSGKFVEIDLKFIQHNIRYHNSPRICYL